MNFSKATDEIVRIEAYKSESYKSSDSSAKNFSLVFLDLNHPKTFQFKDNVGNMNSGIFYANYVLHSSKVHMRL